MFEIQENKNVKKTIPTVCVYFHQQVTRSQYRVYYGTIYYYNIERVILELIFNSPDKYMETHSSFYLGIFFDFVISKRLHPFPRKSISSPTVFF
jgi:hypothetical protein